MIIGVLGVAVIILLCVIAEKFSDKFGMPALIFFMFIGMLFGSDGIVGIPFENYSLTENICSIALVFIMFYGGFNTKWSQARPVAVKAISLSTLGVILTAGITTVVCFLLLDFSFAESFLIGSVLASTDAASVFAILRKNNLNLKNGTASLLELESGSNDPISYMLTTVAISLILGGGTSNIFLMIVLQIVFGIGFGVLFALITGYILSKTPLISEGLITVFMISVVLICYALTAFVGGNAFLSVYIFGIIIGNTRIKGKINLIHFFDGVTSLAQILIFFLIGLLTFPHQMPQIIPTALVIVLVLSLIARPIAVFLLMLPMKCGIKECTLISWAGLRGVASSVFAIMAVSAGVTMKYDLFHIVFMVSLFSVAIQGTLLPIVANKLRLVDNSSDVRKTFNDYQEETDFRLMRIPIPEGHEWADKKIRDIALPAGSLALSLKRDGKSVITRGDTLVKAGDSLILSVPPYTAGGGETLVEKVISKNDAWAGKAIKELTLPQTQLITMIIRGEANIIPEGNTVILPKDILVIYKQKD